MTEKGSEPCIRVLIADDDPDTRVIVSSVVATLGYTAEVVEDGEQALQSCEARLPDLAIVDYMMPGLTGIELCRRVKALRDGEYLPVLMLTARDGVREKVSAFSEGVDDYLTKPFHYQELQARIRALLRVRELTLRLRDKNAELERMQERLIEKERQAVVGQLAGAAAHELGQPLSAIVLNCYLLEHTAPADARYKTAMQAIKNDTKRMTGLLQALRDADAGRIQDYFGNTQILNLSDGSKTTPTRIDDDIANSDRNPFEPER
jgi:DNA-binding response OmpR family regulator